METVYKEHRSSAPNGDRTHIPQSPNASTLLAELASDWTEGLVLGVRVRLRLSLTMTALNPETG